MSKKNSFFKYIRTVVCHSKHDIIKLWCFDAADLVYDWFQPLLIGCAIDDLMNQSYRGLIVFIVLYLIDTGINYFNNTDDNKVYNNIKKEFRCKYYKKAVESNLDTSKIDSNVELVDRPIEFVRCLFVNYFNCVGMLLFSIVFILCNYSLYIGIFVFALNVVNAIVGTYFNQKQIPNVNELYNSKEKRRDKIGSRNLCVYKTFLSNIYRLDFHNSKIDAKGMFFINVITVCMLAVSLFLFTKENDITIGFMFSGIEYIFMLKSSFDMFPDLYYEYKDVSLCIDRIDL